MLREISIKNFAIIDDLRISFSRGFTILSGETGAGKSIIISAVNLLLGSRATAGFVRTGAEYAELEALFDISPDSRTARILAENNLETTELIVRRIIARNNRHRVYINNRLSTIALLTALTENLASISGQHAHQGLLDEEQHLLTLDRFGNLIPLREKVRKQFQQMQPLIRKLEELKELKNRQAEKRELLAFQKNEILEADIKTGETEELEQELLLLKNGETIFRAVHSGIEELYSAQNAIVERLVEVRKQIEKVCQIDPELESKVEHLNDITFRVEDITEGLRAYLDQIPLDEKRMETAEERLFFIRKLCRKYGGSPDSLLTHLKKTEEELDSIENLEERIGETEKDLAGHHETLRTLARELSEKRKKTAEVLAEKVEKELAALKMSDTRFRVSVSPIPFSDANNPWLRANEKGCISENGMDHAGFMIAPNIGEELKPLSQIASGGELSRVVLALKVILAKTESVETVIFDEVDAGIGGSVAEIVGRKIAELSSFHQIICITHLPQIARFGNHHFRISKEVKQGRTLTSITPLTEKERIEELARMLGGVKMTQATLDHAMEMFQEN
ncbi:MAG: DNA repair protein RecN [Desulfococcaceae bacterium]|jgi:DNA repair protein RecN (Recombination protein N)|nr:DNA repair protein RecN [Desulfococcaceae bacterium]